MIEIFILATYPAMSPMDYLISSLDGFGGELE